MLKQASKHSYNYDEIKLLQYVYGYVSISIEDLFDTKNGYTPSKDNNEYWDNGSLPWFRLEDINENGRVLIDSIQHVTNKAVKKSGLFKANSLIITTSATIGEYALIKVPFLCNQRFTVLSLKDEYKQILNPMYGLYYCNVLSAFCKDNLNISNFASVDMTSFNKFEFKIPSLEEQERIVSILDKFDKYCNDISEGLPAEIKHRQQQYEYYRDRLLNFKRSN